MRIQPKTIQRQIKVLKDPNPKFVSIVDHGAIQQPFTVLKHAAKGVSAMPIATRETTKKAETAKPKAQIRKIVFDKSKFPDEKSVTKYLDNNNYKDYVVKTDDNVFTAEGENASDDSYSEIKKIVMEPGVNGFVGKLKPETTQKKETVVKALCPQGEKAIKLDWWRTLSSKETSLAGVLEDGMSDGIPPGMGEIVQATVVAIGNILSDEDEIDRSTKISSVATEMGSLINAVADVFATISAQDAVVKTDHSGMGMGNMGEQGQNEGMGGNRKGTPTTYPRPEDATPDKSGEAMGEGMGGNRKGTPSTYPRPEVAITINIKKTENVEKFVSQFKADMENISKGVLAVTTEAKAEEVKKEDVKDEPKKEEEVQTSASAITPVKESFDLKEFGEIIGAAVAKAIAPLNNRLDEYAAKVDTIAKDTKELQSDTKKTAQTVSEFATRAPTKKAMSDQHDGHDPGTDEKERAKKVEMGVKNFRNVLGMPARS